MNRICVLGFKWTGILISAIGEVPSLCCMGWWTTRGKFKELSSNIMYRMLKKCQTHFGDLAIHVLDRGYANQVVIAWMFKFEQHFLLRWKRIII